MAIGLLHRTHHFVSTAVIFQIFVTITVPVLRQMTDFGFLLDALRVFYSVVVAVFLMDEATDCSGPAEDLLCCHCGRASAFGPACLRRNQRSHFFTRDYTLDIPMDIEIENYDRQAVFLAERNCSGIHYAQPALEHVEIADGVNHRSGAHQLWIGIVNAIHLGGFHDHVGLDFHGAK
jgi:hypothetical protein